MNFSLCTDIFFYDQPKKPLLKKIKDVGFDAIEFWGLNEADEEMLSTELKKNGLVLAAFLTNPRELVDEAKHKAYIEGLRGCIQSAKHLGAARLITTVGQRLEGVSDEKQTESIIKGLRLAAPILEEAGITLVVEPLNLQNHPGYFLTRSDAAFDIIRAVNSPRVKLLFDIYHQQMTEGNLIKNITENINLIGHFHVADVPGRHEPGSGEINWRNVLRAIKTSGYEGYVGLEYAPTYDGFDSMRDVYKRLKSDLEA